LSRPASADTFQKRKPASFDAGLGLHQKLLVDVDFEGLLNCPDDASILHPRPTQNEFTFFVMVGCHDDNTLSKKSCPSLTDVNKGLEKSRHSAILSSAFLLCPLRVADGELPL
jgi:hypothetical protein